MILIVKIRIACPGLL